MARPQPVQQLDLLETVLRRFPKGASIPQISALLSPPPDPRTIERWLNLLIDQHRAVQVAFGDSPLYSATTHAPANVPAPASVPANGSDTNAAAGADAAANGTPVRFPDLFAEVVPDIIAGQMAPPAATFVLQRQGAYYHFTPEQRLAYVAYAKQRLSKLTAADAEVIGILPDQFAIWHTQWTAVPKVTSSKGTMPTAPATTPMATAAGDEPDDPVVRLVVPDAPMASTPARTSSPPAAAEMEEVASVLAGLNLGHLVPALNATVVLGKELFTWTRLAVSVVWGLLVTYFIQKVMAGNVNLYIIELPLVGLPWYFFLRGARAGKKPNTREIVTAIGGGGAVTSFIVGILLPIVIQLSRIGR